jgi:nucleoside-diphosphate-sugar epimerase
MSTTPCPFPHPTGPCGLGLVTGANGYVGAIVARKLLLAGHQRVRCLVRSLPAKRLESAVHDLPDGGPEVMAGNLLSRVDCERAVEGVSVIYHLAAGVEKSNAGCVLNSAVATRNLLDAAARQAALKRVVNVSTIAVYSNHSLRRGAVIDERCPVDNRLVERHEPYTYGKAMQDEVVCHASRLGLPCVTLRPGVVFGPGKAKITDRVGTATFGVFLHLGLANRIPLTYIDNCADAIVLAGLRPGIEGEVLNIVDDDLPTSRQFLNGYKQHVRRFFSLPVPYPLWFGFCRMWEKYSRWSEGQLPPVFNRRSCIVYWRGNNYSNEKAKRLLGWSPRVPMAQALKSYFAYVNDQRSRPR